VRTVSISQPRRVGGLVRGGAFAPTLLIIVGLLICGWAILDRLYQPRLICGPMLQVADRDAVTVVWSARVQREACESGELVVTDANGGVRRLTARGAEEGYLHARIDLPSATQPVEYRIVQHGFMGRRVQVGDAVRIRGPKPRGEPFRFLAFGDSGKGNEIQRRLASQMVAARPDLMIHTGDVAYPTGHAFLYEKNVFGPYQALLPTVPLMPSPGNHDYDDEDFAHGYRSVFALPENGPPGVDAERVYWFDFGDARFVSLDSNPRSNDGVLSEADMRSVIVPWLRQVLSESGPAWRLVYFHHPPYTGCTRHKAEDRMKEIFCPVFDECDVDMVFCGHNHLYERTKPIRAGRIVGPGEGTVYITSGAGGADLYPEAAPPPDFMAAFNDRAHSFTRVDVSAERIKLAQIGIDGSILDTFEAARAAGETKR